MGEARKPLDGLAISMMVVLCACWGLQQAIIKAAASSLTPMVQAGIRCTVAALLVYGLRRWQGNGIGVSRQTFWSGVAAGILFAAEFVAVSMGLLHTTASHMTVFLYTAPIFTAVGLHGLVPGERLRPSQWLGVAAAFAGISLAFSEGFHDAGAQWSETLWGDGLGVLGGILWAATTVVIRSTALSEAPPTVTLLYQLAAGALVLLVIAGGSGQFADASLTPMAWMSLFYQTVIIAFVSYLAWFWLLRRYIASRLSIFTFLTPILGVVFGVLLLNEPVGGRFAGGAVLVILGIVLVNRRQESKEREQM